MNAAEYNLKINRGSPINIPLTFRSTAGVAIDLTGLTFKCQIREKSRSTLILDIPTGPDDSNLLVEGKIVMSCPYESTLDLPLGSAYWDLIDSTGVKWIKGKVFVEPNISEL